MGSHKVVWCVDMPEIRNNLSGTIYAYIHTVYKFLRDIDRSKQCRRRHWQYIGLGLAKQTKGQGTAPQYQGNRPASRTRAQSQSSATALLRTFFRLAPTQSRAL